GGGALAGKQELELGRRAWSDAEARAGETGTDRGRGGGSRRQGCGLGLTQRGREGGAGVAAGEADAGGVARVAARARVGDDLGAAVGRRDVELAVGSDQFAEIERNARHLARGSAADAARGDGAAIG